MSDLAETTRPRAETRGPQDDSRPAMSGARAVLRGAVRPDLIRDEVLGEIFRDSARARLAGTGRLAAGSGSGAGLVVALASPG